MPADTDLIQLYSKRILALAADIPLTKPLEACAGSAKRRSPLCGSTVTACVDMQDGKISQFSQDVKACALGQAAAAITAQAAVGAPLTVIETARDQLKAMLKGKGGVPDAPFDGFEVLTPAVEYKNRHASILLSIEAIAEAMETVRTEA